ncbi:hypothetical protein [Microbacterium ulmi]|uniref:EthD domain-containing protein n=1 Tax=Microbacterium ulmi TaxID=179095 RepID=A0A7Y2LYM5_9MICO|nr:hypothetical protein [Microbacterium ulmi]NII69863.1 hypothetical protein [Microbacterium ulmi]NNH03170.1 hypothetical protein [Microbacterium ulmi]
MTGARIDMGSGILTERFVVEPSAEGVADERFEQARAGRLERLGARAVTRFRSYASPLEHLAIWELDDVRAALSAASALARWEELPTAHPPAAPPPEAAEPGIRLVTMEIPEERWSEFDSWYAEDHIPTLIARPEYLGIRRFKAVGGSTSLALWYLADGGLHTRPGFVPAAPTERGRRVQTFRTGSAHSSWAEIRAGLPAPGAAG